MAKKNTKTKAKKNSKAASANGVPQIKAAKETVRFTTLVADANMELGEPLPKKSVKALMDSIEEEILAQLAAGRAVNLFGVIKLTPRLHTAGTREVYKEFGNPESGKVKKKYPAKVTLKATVLKKAKDELPKPAKMGTMVKS